MLTANCRELIIKAHAYDVSFGNDLTNHLPMALIALEKIGAQSSQLKNFYNQYIARLTPMKDLTDIQYEPDQLIFGNRDSFPQFYIFYLRELKEAGIKKTLLNHLPQLIKGLGTSAFHGIIRLAFAVESEIIEEIAISLAYWSSDFVGFGSIGPISSKSMNEILEASLPVMKEYRFIQGNITQRMKQVDQFAPIQTLLVQPERISLNDLALLVIITFKITENFTILHGVTSCQALRSLLPYINDKETALRYYWESLHRAILTTVHDYHEQRKIDYSDSIKDIMKYACNSSDAHTIKLLYSCQLEFEKYGYEEYMDSIRLKASS